MDGRCPYAQCQLHGALQAAQPNDDTPGPGHLGSCAFIMLTSSEYAQPRQLQAIFWMAQRPASQLPARCPRGASRRRRVLWQHRAVLLPQALHHSDAHAGGQVEGPHVLLRHRDFDHGRGCIMCLLRQPSGLRTIPAKGRGGEAPVAAIVSQPADKVSELQYHDAPQSAHTCITRSSTATNNSAPHQGGSQLLQQRQQRT